VAFLLLRGELPGKQESAAWAGEITNHTYVHENVKKFIDGFLAEARTGHLGQTQSEASAGGLLTHARGRTVR
jgi:citrate synthase